MSAGFDSMALRCVVMELQRSILGAQIQKVRQPDGFTVLLRLHGHGVSRWLLVSAHAEEFRAHLTTRTFPNPQEPPSFCMALRKYLEGGRITDVRQDGADRVLRIGVLSSWGSLQLVCELMGRHSNIILLAGDGTVLEAIKHVGSRMSHRVILPGRPYAALPSPDKPSLWDAPLEELRRVWEHAVVPVSRAWLMESFGGMSPALAGRIAASSDPRAEWESIVAAVRVGGASIGVSERLDEDYSGRCLASRRDALLRKAHAILDKEASVLGRRQADIDAIERRAVHAEEWRIAGELLSANAHAIEKGAASVTLPNYYAADQAPMEIALDASLSPHENAEAYFARQRKVRAAVDRVPEQRREIAALRSGLEARRAMVREAGEDELESLLAQWAGEPGPQLPRNRREESPFPPGVRIRKYTSEEGWPIWVGENATGNDYLTTRLSDPSDIWLHVRAAASAHGVIRTAKHPEKVPYTTLHRAAEMVAAHSEVKGSSVIPVDYTLRRYVRKPRGAAPGRVTYSNEKTIEVRPK